MPLNNTLTALKSIFSAFRTLTSVAAGSTFLLTPADIGRLIIVDTDPAVANPTVVTLPRIAGDATTGVNGIGAGGTIAILRVGSNAGELRVNSPTPNPDTFNGGTAFAPLVLAAQNAWLIAVSPGGAGIQNWGVFASRPGAF